MRTQAEIFTRFSDQMLAGLKAIQAAKQAKPIPGRTKNGASPLGVGIRVCCSKYNPYTAHIHRDGRAISIGSFPTLAAAQQGQRDAYAGLPLRSGTKAGRIV